MTFTLMLLIKYLEVHHMFDINDDIWNSLKLITATYIAQLKSKTISPLIEELAVDFHFINN